MKKTFTKLILVIFIITLIPISFIHAQTMSQRLSGRLLLQVEDGGRVWYVNPEDGKRYEVTILNSLPLFRKFALGVSLEDLKKIPMFHESIVKDFGLGLKGKLLLDVERRGRIWYVDFQGFRHEVKQDNILDLFRRLSLGILNKDLSKISIGVIGSSEVEDDIDSDIQDLSAESLINNSDFQSFWELWSLIKQKYAGSDVDDAELFEGAKKGLVESLGDDYSVFMDKEESSEFLSDLSGQFEGIGAEIGIRNNILTIISPLPDTPAEKAGIKAGDQVLSIDGVSTANMTLTKAVSLIRGEKGTNVVLGVKHKDGTEEDIIIVRDTITYSSLTYEMKEENIGYIRMIRFNSDVSSLFSEAVEDLLSEDIKGIILDLRNNPGGYMNMAINTAGYWIDNDVVVIEKFKDRDDAKNHISSGEAKLKDIETIVLVNEGSASASEIVAGALQDYNLATIIGEKTFGKGSVQEMRLLSDGSYIKFTIAKWYTPKNNSIDGEGITPDVVVEYSAEDYSNSIDTQLNKALELLK